MGVSRSVDKKEEPKRELVVDSQRVSWRKVRLQRNTDQCASQIDTCRPRVWAVDPLGLREAEKPGACHGVDVYTMI